MSIPGILFYNLESDEVLIETMNVIIMGFP